MDRGDFQKRKREYYPPLFLDIFTPYEEIKKSSTILYKSKQIELHTCIEKSLVGFWIPICHHCQWNIIFHYL